jgi:hypothetical protein
MRLQSIDSKPFIPQSIAAIGVRSVAMSPPSCPRGCGPILLSVVRAKVEALTYLEAAWVNLSSQLWFYFTGLGIVNNSFWRKFIWFVLLGLEIIFGLGGLTRFGRDAIAAQATTNAVSAVGAVKENAE